MESHEIATHATSSLVPPTGDEVTTNDVPSQAPVLSKNAQKKIIKAQKREAQKLERRAREKAVKAAKKEAKRKREAEADGGDDNDEESRSNKRRKIEDGSAGIDEENEAGDLKEQRQPPKPRTPFGSKIVIDLGFDDKMTEREIISLTSQCAYLYSSNRKSSNPFSALLYTSLNGRTKARFDMLATYQNWKNVEWWEEGYDLLWDANTDLEQPPTEDGLPSSRTYTCPVTHASKPRTSTEKEKVVYLTADSDVELLELNPEETYIIGGIVDKNRYKALCQNKAQTQSVRTARLPIGIYLKELPTRKVLTVNQVFDILMKWVEHRDWRKALFEVIPMRKFHKEGKSARRNKIKQSGSTLKAQDEDEEDGDEPMEDGAEIGKADAEGDSSISEEDD